MSDIGTWRELTMSLLTPLMPLGSITACRRGPTPARPRQSPDDTFDIRSITDIQELTTRHHAPNTC